MTPSNASYGGETSGLPADLEAMAGGSGYGEFEIDIEDVLRKTLPPFFSRITPAPLQTESVREVPPGAKGAYLLLYEGEIVYAGKTDTRHGFRDRLGRHAESVRHRTGLDPGRRIG